MADAKLPLENLTVLDLTRVRAGPTCVRQFADWGAHCIKIEATADADPRGHDPKARIAPDFWNLHRNKRSITLNLKKPDAKEIFFKLVEKADIIVENYRPGVKHRLGIDYEACKKVNPHIVYGSISGFGQTGPYAERPGVDQIAQGMGGLMSITGEPGQGPLRVGVPISDLTAGMYCAMGILVALYEREVTGVGRWVHTSLLEAEIAMLDYQVTRWTITKEVPPQAGNNHPKSCPVGLFPTKDGNVNISAGGDYMFKRMSDALDAPQLLEVPEFKDKAVRLANRQMTNDAVGEVTKEWATEDIVNTLNDAGVPCGPVYTIDKMLEDPQVKHVGMTWPCEHPEKGAVSVNGNAINLEGVPKGVRNVTPALGDYNDELLASLGYDAASIEKFRGDGVI
jgi:formyl-CoA transferase